MSSRLPRGGLLNVRQEPALRIDAPFACNCLPRYCIIIQVMDVENLDTVGMLKGSGLRATPARRLILTLLVGHANHLCTDEILTELSKLGHRIATATIYQNLAKLVEAGLLIRFTGADGIVKYDSNLAPHHHLSCTGCGRVIDVDLDTASHLRGLRPTVARTGESPRGWRLVGIRMELKGLCPACLRRK
jgi:Fur family peroxide stress response transcriptional regulator